MTLIDRQNYNLFQPLLYQVATAALSPADIAEPIRKIVRRYPNIAVLMGEVSGIDVSARAVLLAEGNRVPYDELVIATGSEYHYFGHDDWARYAPGLKTIDNARAIRARLLRAFEQAENCTSPAHQTALMTSVVIGGGPTGVEMAGAIAELTRWTLARDFRHIDPGQAKVILVEAGSRLLSTFPEALSAHARTKLENLGVEVMTSTPVEEVRSDGVVIAGNFVPAATLIWGAGTRASPAARWIGLSSDRAGRLPVGPNLEVEAHPGVYAIGDTALCLGDDGKPLPALAQVAKQQGAYLGRALAAGTTEPFRFRNRGNTAVIGRNAAVFDFGSFHLKGRLAWLLWAIVHVFLLVSFEKRMLVSLQWLWRYLTYSRGARLILEQEGRSSSVMKKQTNV